MIKILSSRGTGRSYQIARYAIENNCNILVAYYNGVKYMRAILDDIFKSDGYVIDKQDSSDDGFSYDAEDEHNFYYLGEIIKNK